MDDNFKFVPFEQWAQDAAGSFVNIRAELRSDLIRTHPPTTGKLDITGLLTGWAHTGETLTGIEHWTLDVGPVVIDTRTWFITHWAIVEQY